MNKPHGILGLALALFVTTGCSRAHAPAPTESVGAAAAGPKTGGGAAAPVAPLASSRALVVTMDISLTVTDVDHARMVLRDAVARDGGYVADSSMFGIGNSEHSVRMDLRVPAKQAADVRAELGRLGEITSDVEKVEDVTEEHVDLDARLANARASEKRILEIMATKAGALHEVLEAEKEVARIRESIERMEAQQRSLDGRIDLATLHVTLNAPPELAAWQTPGKSISAAASSGLRGAEATAVSLAIAFVTVAPTLLPIAAVITLFSLGLRRRRARLLGSAR